MKVTKTTTSEQETSSEIDLFSDTPVPANLKDRVRQDVGEFLVEQIQIALGQSKSPVSGRGAFKTLSKDYAEFKKKEVGHSGPNLELEGDMLGELTFEATRKGIAVGVFGDSAGKADGHNNLSGKSKIPTRRFLPSDEENFKADIQAGVKDIILDIMAEESELDREDFKEVETKADLYDVLSQAFVDLSRSEIRNAVMRSDSLVKLLRSLKLMELL